VSGIRRRGLLLGAAAALAAPALRSAAAATPPDTLQAILEASGLAAVSGFAVADLDAGGRLLEGHAPEVGRPPASVLKTLTTLYALEALGAGYRFHTRLLATGPVAGGTLAGED